MNFKRAFFAATAAMMLPGLAMAATFTTDMIIDPDTGDSITVNFQCNAGDNLTDSFSLADGDSVTFTNNIPVGVTADCSITASAPAGYANVAAPCTYTGVDNDFVTSPNCAFLFLPDPFVFEVGFEVDDTAAEADGNVTFNVVCENLVDNGGLTTRTVGSGFFDYPEDDGVVYTTPPAGIANAEEDSDGDPINQTVCFVETFGNSDSAVEISGCNGTIVEFGDEDASCTLTATVFFEGIPTLSQYGMAVMVLLMLGVGFVGFRRFV